MIFFNVINQLRVGFVVNLQRRLVIIPWHCWGSLWDDRETGLFCSDVQRMMQKLVFIFLKKTTTTSCMSSSVSGYTDASRRNRNNIVSPQRSSERNNTFLSWCVKQDYLWLFKSAFLITNILIEFFCRNNLEHLQCRFLFSPHHPWLYDLKYTVQNNYYLVLSSLLTMSFYIDYCKGNRYLAIFLPC